MNFNLPSILQNGMKILNIVNKTLPLVKEFNPALGLIKKKLKSVNIASNTTPPIKKNTLVQTQNKTSSKNTPSINNGNNTLTFFR